jgi:uncharacterized membrane protein
MAVGHLKLRKMLLLVVFLVIAGGTVAACLFLPMNAWQTAGVALIALILFLNASRVIYPARRILREAAEAAARTAKTDGKEKKQTQK